MIVQLVEFLSLFILMLVTGIFWGPWFSLHRSLNRFSKGEFLKIVNTLAANLAVPMRFLMPVCILLLGLFICFYPIKSSIGFYVLILSFLLTLSALLITVLVEISFVKQMQEWTENTMPFTWEKIRDNWVKYHVIRTFLSIGSFACLAISILMQHV